MMKLVTSFYARIRGERQLFDNIISLFLLQGANYILPLITIPYLVRVFGPELFGLLSFSSSTIGYFVLITDYGFNLSATRQVSIYRDDKSKINQIVSSVMIIKVFLMLFSLALLCILVSYVDFFKKDSALYFVTFGTVVGQVFFPVWFFQGMEKMKYVTILNIISKVIFTVLIFFFVKDKSDYLWVPILTSLGFFVSAIWSFYLLKKVFKIQFSLQKFNDLKAQLFDGFHIFFSSISISLYTNSITFILGIFTNNTIVGYYSGAEKIIQAIKGLYSPVSQAIYPYIGKRISENKLSGLQTIKKVTKLVGGSMLVISIFVFFFSENLVSILLGSGFQESVKILMILSFLPFFVSLSNMLGIQTILNLGYKKAFSFIVMISAVIGICLNLILVPTYKAEGSAWSVLIVEILVTINMAFFLKKRGYI
jgi:PST family polysaccharide transporter